MLSVLKAALSTLLPKPKPAPKFLLEETASRFVALKEEIPVRTKQEHEKILHEASVACPPIQREAAAMRQRAADLRKEAEKLDAIDAEVKRREAQALEEQAADRLQKMPNTPEVMRPRLQESLARIIKNIDSWAEREARQEERAKIRREGIVVFISPRLEGGRKIHFFQGRYFISVLYLDYDWVTDSLQQLSEDELAAVARHKAQAPQ